MFASPSDRTKIKSEMAPIENDLRIFERNLIVKNPNFNPSASTNKTSPFADLNNPQEVVVLNDQQVSGWNSARQNVFNSWSGFHQDNRLLDQGPAAQRLYGGRMNEARILEARTVTSEAMKKLHQALETMPKGKLFKVLSFF